MNENELSLAGASDVKSIELIEGKVILRSPRGDIEYLVRWETLVVLKVSKQLRLTKLPTLPPNLEVFRCSLTGLEELPTLPDSLRHLKARDLKITSVGTLPRNLEVLDLANSNRILSLPKLPSSLRILRVGHLDLRWLGSLPPRLEKLEAAGCQLSRLPTLPVTLVELCVPFNNLDELPELAHLVNLEMLSVYANFLRELPPLPPSIKLISCARNLLRTLPPLPRNLETLVASRNRLVSLPPSERLEVLHVDDNPLLEMPYYPSLRGLHAEPRLLISVRGLYEERILCARLKRYDCPSPPTQDREAYAKVLDQLRLSRLKSPAFTCQ